MSRKIYILLTTLNVIYRANSLENDSNMTNETLGDEDVLFLDLDKSHKEESSKQDIAGTGNQPSFLSRRILDNLEKISENIVDSNDDDYSKEAQPPCDKVTSETEKYPYSVSLIKKGAHYATGALVSSNWVLTTAKEFFNVRESIKFFIARLGSINCKRGGITKPLQSVFLHPNYQYGSPKFDVALVKLSSEVKFSTTLHPINMSSVRGRVLSGRFLTVYWPVIVVNGLVRPENASERIKISSLRVSKQSAIPWTICQRILLKDSEILHHSSICLQPITSHHTSCSPDPGAPVVAANELWGVTSGWSSPECNNSSTPALATRLSAPVVRRWINKTMKLFE